MSETPVIRFKWFWIWQDDREETWLAEMSRQGLHLKSPGLFGRYLFERGESRAYAYFMDLASRSKDRDENTEALENRDWRLIGQLGSTRYWRREVRTGDALDLHTERSLLLRKYQGMLRSLIIYLPIFLVLMTRTDDITGRYQHWSIEVIFAALYVLFLLYLFTILMLSRRILTLRQAAKEK